MKHQKKILTIIGIAIILINVLHSFWYLCFSSIIWLALFKIALFAFCTNEFLRENSKLKIPIYLYRTIVLITFILLLGIQKMNFGLLPFSGKYEVIEICTDENYTKDNLKKSNRIERLEKNSGLYDTYEKTEMVYSFLYIFEWRFEITEITKYKENYQNCYVLISRFP